MSYEKFAETVPHWSRASRMDYNHETGGDYGRYTKGRKGNVANYRRSGVHRPAVLAAFKTLRKLGVVALANGENIEEKMAAKSAHSAVWISNEDHAWPSNIGSYSGEATGKSAGVLWIKFRGAGPNDEGILEVGHALVEALKNEKIDGHLHRWHGGGEVAVGPSTRLYEFTAEERAELVESTTRHRLAELKSKLRSEEREAEWAWERAELERNTVYEVGSTEVYMGHSVGGMFTRMEILEVIPTPEDDFSGVEYWLYIVRPVDGIGITEVYRTRLLTKSEAEASEKAYKHGLPANRRERLAVYA